MLLRKTIVNNYTCPSCLANLEPYFSVDDNVDFYGLDGEFIYCSKCNFTASEITFQGSTYVEEKKDKLRTQVEADSTDDDLLEWT